MLEKQICSFTNKIKFRHQVIQLLRQLLQLLQEAITKLFLIIIIPSLSSTATHLSGLLVYLKHSTMLFSWWKVTKTLFLNYRIPDKIQPNVLISSQDFIFNARTSFLSHYLKRSLFEPWNSTLPTPKSNLPPWAICCRGFNTLGWQLPICKSH